MWETLSMFIENQEIFKLLCPLIISTFSLGQKGCAYYEKTAYYECTYYERAQYIRYKSILPQWVALIL